MKVTISNQRQDGLFCLSFESPGHASIATAPRLSSGHYVDINFFSLSESEIRQIAQDIAAQISSLAPAQTA